ncbi:hypothetical protein Hypma_002062 [Hypsizygus marmoreus]|uniref:Uncharacterized protein n=1 Tax=Hypsizygus marmoreus TaxID=39966 RepID=A0A369JC58_HYPMA|nr:hypothetical protein Hypma_002062 [Hypsizygus marmoreus]
MLDHNDFESLFFPVKEAIVSVPGGETCDTFEYARMPGSPTIWRQNGDLAFIQSVTPSHFSSSKCLWTRPAIGISKPLHLAYGQSNDVNGIVDLGSGSQFAVEIAEGLNTRFDVFNSNNEAFTAFQTGDYSIGYLE